MKTIKIAVILALMCSITTYAQTIPIHKITKKISIDGDLSDWKTPFLGPFVIHDSGQKLLRILWFHFRGMTKTYTSLTALQILKSLENLKKKDAKIFNTDDLVELFLDPDGDGQNYIEIGVNAFSTNYDMLLKCISPNCGGWNTSMTFDISGLETASKITPKGFNTEIKIPFSSLKTIKNGNFKKPKIGTKWRGNAFRIDYGNTTE